MRVEKHLSLEKDLWDWQPRNEVERNEVVRSGEVIYFQLVRDTIDRSSLNKH